MYGDYMKIPEDKSTHDYIEFDPDVPYKNFFSKNLKQLMKEINQ
jgi:hypothetical protein